MTYKEKLKKVLGYNNIMRLKRINALIKYGKTVVRGNKGGYLYNQEMIEEICAIEKKNQNVFFGYYDLAQLDSKGQKALIHIVSEKADPKRDFAELAWYDLQTKEIHVFARTRAWSWQQGARLRWHPCIDHCVMYNDYEDGKYVTRFFDLDAEEIRETVGIALYDIASDGNYGLGLNFSRLQRLRPGYGYSVVNDDTIGMAVPEHDGIFLWDKRKNSITRIISLKELAIQSGSAEQAEHYINHIAIDPTGTQFIFFHLWSFGLGMKWKMALYKANIDGSGLTCIDDSETISHYCWKDSDTLLTTALASERVNHAQYIVYDLKKNTKTVLNDTHLQKDGHPSWLSDGSGFISDTYPQQDSFQYLFRADAGGKNYKELARLYANPMLLEEHRCDLHPRLDERHGIITIDTTRTGVRSVAVLKMK